MFQPELDLGKNWHALHYILNGSAWGIGEGAGAAILGGVEVGEDNGYGPARLLDAASVGAIAAGLDTLSVDMLRARFDDGVVEAVTDRPHRWSEPGFMARSAIDCPADDAAWVAGCSRRARRHRGR
jgi:hypothetical protein